MQSTTPWIIDGLIIAGYFFVILWIGLSMGQKDRDLQEFALADRKIPWWAVLGSIIAAETSAGTFIGTPGEGYALRNYTYLQLAIGTILARIIIGFLFIKPFYDHRVTSIYEFLTIRFGERTKNAASSLFLVTRVLASGTRLYVSAIILVIGYRIFAGTTAGSVATTDEFWIYLVALLTMTLLTTFYTSIGGIKAVIWTDLIQATVMIGSAFLAVWVLYHHIQGGWEGLGAGLNHFQDVKFFDLGLSQDSNASWGTHLKAILESEYTIFAALIGSTFTTMATHGTDQDMVQRLLTAQNIRKSRLSLILSGLVDIPIVFLFLSIGILLSVYYQQTPDPNLPAKTNEIFCYFILKEMPVGIRGLLIAGIFATAMGSLSAALNALATSFVKDWYLPFIRPRANSAQTLRAAKRATVVFALLMVVVASVTAWVVIHSPKSRIIPIALGVFGYTYGSLLGIFLLGILTRRRGNDHGNLIAMAAGLVVTCLVSGVPQDLARLMGYEVLETTKSWIVVEFPWRVFIGTLVTFGVGVLFSAPEKSHAHNKRS